MSFLLDTNVISEAERPRPHERVLNWLREQNESRLYLSALSVGEIKKGAERLDSIPKKTHILDWLEEVRARFSGRILSLSEETFIVWGKLYADFQRSGISRPAFDSLLEATALEHDLVLVTRNVRNFYGSSVTILNPWEE
jgi:Predicted nucleic acid-binding protein, contains PIN domain